MDAVTILKYASIVFSVLIIIFIVLQPKDADSGTLFGGGFADEVKRTRRGVELFLHNATIVTLVMWIATAISIMLLEG